MCALTQKLCNRIGFFFHFFLVKIENDVEIVVLNRFFDLKQEKKTAVARQQ